MIKFNEELHRYVTEDTGSELVSVTTLIGKYKPKFDKKENATRVANREGLTVDFVLDMWEKEKNKACDYGTSIHKVMEDFLIEGKKEDKYYDLYRSYEYHAKQLFYKHKNFKSEEMVYNIPSLVAGTADLIYENDKSFYIGDFKTNKRFNYQSDFNEFMTGPVSHLSVCEFNTYALQLSLYALLYERMVNKKCAGLVIFYKEKEHTEDYEETFDVWRPIRVNYMKAEATALISDYNRTNLRPLENF